MKVLYHVADQTACTWYRLIQPCEIANKNKAIQARPMYQRDDPAEVSKLVAGADIIFMGRIADEGLIPDIQRAQRDGKKVIVDHDDNYFDISPLSIHYADYGTREVHYNVNGENIPLWIDGKKGFDIERNKKNLESVKRVCEAVDAVTVTTERLAEVYRPYAREVFTLPNCVNLETWRKLPLTRQSDEIRMGWGGGASHAEDWFEIARVIPRIVEKYPKLKIVICGHKFGAAFKGVPEDRVEFHPWAHLMAHPYKQATLDLDFAVIPLKDMPFNHGKSAIKWIEYGALHVPSVCSNIPPYSDIADMVPDNGIFVENTDEAWMAGLSLMIENAELRRIMGERAFKTVKDNFDANATWPQWVSVFNQVMAYEPRLAKEGVTV